MNNIRQDIRTVDLHSNRRPLSIFQSTGLDFANIESEVMEFKPLCWQRMFLFTAPGTACRTPSLTVKWCVPVVSQVQIPANQIEISVSLPRAVDHKGGTVPLASSDHSTSSQTFHSQSSSHPTLRDL
jgi:hypothetical protein